MKIRATLFIRALALAAGVFMLASPVAAQYFADDGKSSASLSLATAKQFDRDYTVLSGRYGRFFVDEFEASIGLELWRGHTPEIYKIIPELRYVSSRGGMFKPYGAVFLTRTFYSSTVTNHNSFGVRGGMYYELNPRAYLGLGLVHERLESCDQAVLKDCHYLYPELTLHFRL